MWTGSESICTAYVTLIQVIILSTCSICNTFSIVFLPTGVAAIAGICTFGREFLAAALTDQILTVYLAVLSLPPIIGLIAAPVTVTIFLGVDCGVKHLAAAVIDDFADTIISSGLLFFVSLFQVVLILPFKAFVIAAHRTNSFHWRYGKTMWSI